MRYLAKGPINEQNQDENDELRYGSIGLNGPIKRCSIDWLIDTYFFYLIRFLFVS